MKEDFVPCFFPVTAMYIWGLLRSLSEHGRSIFGANPCQKVCDGGMSSAKYMSGEVRKLPVG